MLIDRMIECMNNFEFTVITQKNLKTVVDSIVR